jgi:hypothetical protein
MCRCTTCVLRVLLTGALLGAPGSVDGVDEGVSADVAEAGEATAVVDELVPAAQRVPVEQPLMGKELPGGEGWRRRVRRRW